MSPASLFATIFGVILGVAVAYPSGAPEEVCNSFTAQHDEHTPQNSQVYELVVSPSSVAPGQTVTVTLKGKRGEKLKGFFIQGQDKITKKVIGKFIRQSDAQTRDCSGHADSVTHVDADDKSKVQIKWQAPSNFNGNVVFRSVVVKNFENFWNNVVSNTLNVS